MVWELNAVRYVNLLNTNVQNKTSVVAAGFILIKIGNSLAIHMSYKMYNIKLYMLSAEQNVYK